MITRFLEDAKKGEPVYINRVYDAFQAMPESESKELHCILTLLEREEKRLFSLRIPSFTGEDAADRFIREYVWAELYNILSSLGGIRMEIFFDTRDERLKAFVEELNEVFDIDSSRKERRNYGRAINVIDRMLDTLNPDSPGFRFVPRPLYQLPELPNKTSDDSADPEVYRRVLQNMQGKLFCGIDVGGTDIKIVLVENGSVNCYKEYDWFPAQFTSSIQLVDPILLIVRLMRAKATLDALGEAKVPADLGVAMEKALDVSAGEEQMTAVCEQIEKKFANELAVIDGVGMCFPDVVVRDKIVGGEVYKTRGIRNNPGIDYEADFKQLTDLNDRIAELIKEGGAVNIINDGPMASFTAAVEVAASTSPDSIRDGVFAHTLGTELGTGWVDEKGAIPDIPLEVYNFIIDLGSAIEREYHPDDLRSINNFNTGLPGTLQKYASQSGVFRLAMKYFPDEAPTLFEELQEKGFVAKGSVGGRDGYYVPTEPKDLRKPFLEHMMSLPEREGDEVNERIWREIGEYLAVTWIETKKILNPRADSRVLFGRLVKRKRCFDLMVEGARQIKSDIVFEIADSSLANTPLMMQLEADPHFTVAQFAQAIGAAYFANQ